MTHKLTPVRCRHQRPLVIPKLIPIKGNDLTPKHISASGPEDQDGGHTTLETPPISRVTSPDITTTTPQQANADGVVISNNHPFDIGKTAIFPDIKDDCPGCPDST